MLNTDKNLKLYYSISEVAAMFDVNESLLRFWEKEFPQLNPKDNKEATIRNFEIVDRLRAIREELVGMKLALDEFTYEDVESLKENIQGLK